MRRRRRSRRASWRGPVASDCSVNGLERLEPRVYLTAVAIVSPAANSVSAPAGTDVRAVFDQDIDFGTGTDLTFAVHAMQTGRLIEPAHGNTVTNLANTIIFDPDDDFRPGEIVQVSVTGGVLSVGAPVAPYVWQFRAGTTGGGGDFIDSGQALAPRDSTDVSLGDVSGDGNLDAIVTTFDQGDRVWLGDGGGHFSDTGQDLGNHRSYGVSLGDLDSDGDLDIFVANANNEPNRVWRNNGSGAFTDSGQILGNHYSFGVRLGDVDGDGDLDAFTANAFGQGNRMWRNDGSAGFTDSNQSLGSGNSRGVSLGDVDGDGDLDAFVANVSGGNRVWRNDGVGNFTDTGQDLASQSSYGVSLGDLDGDGDLDAFVTNSGPNRIWRGDGSGGFTDSGQLLGNHLSGRVSLGDVDGDGDLDAFVANRADQPNRIWNNDGSGTFSDSGRGLGDQYTRTVSLGDLDGDGDLDAFAANDFGQADRVWINSVFDFGDAPGPFPTLSADDGAGHAIVSGGPQLRGAPAAGVDAETDGAPSTNADGDDTTGAAPDDEDGVIIGTLRAGQIGATIDFNVVDAPAGGALLDAWIDFNGDGTWDGAGERIATGHPVGNGLDAITFNVPSDAIAGTQTFARFRISTDGVDGPRGLARDGEVEDHALTIDPGFAATSWIDSGQLLGNPEGVDVSLGDLDGDGDLDAFVASFANQPNFVWLNDGDGNFVDNGQRLGDHSSRSVSLGDVDGDGDLDAFVANSYAPDRVYLNDGGGNFTDSGQVLGYGASYDARLGDLDGDGDLDVFVANAFGEGGSNGVWLNDGGGNFVDSGQFLDSGGAVRLGDVDGDGDLDAFVVNPASNTVWLNDGDGSFADSGQALSAYGTYASRDVGLADLDGDGNLDAFVVDFNPSGGNRVWSGDGSGNFTDSGQRLGDRSSQGVSLGDVDGDGDLDAFVSNGETNVVWRNDGSGAFSEAQRLGDHFTYAASLGDLDGDGDLDAFVANGLLHDNRVWLNEDLDYGDAPTPFPTLIADNGAGHAIVSGGPQLGTSSTIDDEADGQPEANATGDDTSGAAPDDEDGVVIGTLRAGQLGATIDVTVVDGPARLDAWIDFNGDGTWDGAGERIATGQPVGSGLNPITFDVPPDAIAGAQTFARFRISTDGVDGPRGLARDGEVEDHALTIESGGGSANHVFIDSGQVLGDHEGVSVSLGDLDGDGDLDAFVASFAAEPNLVWRNDGGGNFSDTGQRLGAYSSKSVSLGDVDGDGDLDAFVTNSGYAPDRVYHNDGSGNFTDTGQALGYGASYGAQLGDLDGDGDLDAFVVANNGDPDRVWTNDGSGNFSDSGQDLGADNGTAVRLGDVDGDGDLDAFVANISTQRVWRNDGGGTSSKAARRSIRTTVGMSVSVTWTATATSTRSSATPCRATGSG